MGLALEAGSQDNATAVVCDVERTDAAAATAHPRFYGAAADRFCEDLELA